MSPVFAFIVQAFVHHFLRGAEAEVGASMSVHWTQELEYPPGEDREIEVDRLHAACLTSSKKLPDRAE